jgi:hypothetical protein
MLCMRRRREPVMRRIFTRLSPIILHLQNATTIVIEASQLRLTRGYIDIIAHAVTEISGTHLETAIIRRHTAKETWKPRLVVLVISNRHAPKHSWLPMYPQLALT